MEATQNVDEFRSEEFKKIVLRFQTGIAIK